LVTYVIGLKIAGMSREQLREAVFIAVADSGAASRAEAEVGVPSDDFVLIGGGFRVDPGHANLATAFFPSSDFSWKARSQDQNGVFDNANITVFAICLRRNLPVGQVRVSRQHNNGPQANHPSAVATPQVGFALTGGGAEIPQVNQGNFLWSLEPAADRNPSFTAFGKDHGVAAACPIIAHALGIQLF
jgi:hypothetical protein